MAELKMNPAKKVSNLKRNFENCDKLDNNEVIVVEKSVKMKDVMTKQDKLEEVVKPVETRKQISKTMKKSQALKMKKPQVVKKMKADVETVPLCDVNMAREPPPKFVRKLAPKLFPIFEQKLKPAGDPKTKTGFDMPATLPDYKFIAQVCTEGTESEDSPANERPGHSWQWEPGRDEEFWQAGIGQPGEEPGQPGQ